VLEKGPIEGAKREVTFVLPGDVGGERVNVCGEFNDWSETSVPMFRDENGDFRATVLLEVGNRFRYRYLVDGERWENDWHADDYISNEFGGEDSAVDV
jgi:1,4-alpha-glucan branching enzyme